MSRSPRIIARRDLFRIGAIRRETRGGDASPQNLRPEIKRIIEALATNIVAREDMEAVDPGDRKC